MAGLAGMEPHIVILDELDGDGGTLVAPGDLGEDDHEPCITHIVCHDEDLALCGQEVGDVAWCDSEQCQECVVCTDLEAQGCGWKCGEYSCCV